MSDVLSRILAGMLGGAQEEQARQGREFGEAGRRGGNSPLGEPRLPRVGTPQYDDPRGRSGLPSRGGLEDVFGGGAGAGGLGSILGGLLGGMRGGAPAGQTRSAPSGDGGLGGLAGGLGGVKGMVLMALLAYLMRGRGGRDGLSSLTQQFSGAGLDEHVGSWVGSGANRELRPEELARVIPPDALEAIERETGLPRDEVLSDLSRGLPGMVDRLTPRGRMPDSDDELNEIDERDLLGNFGIGGVPGEPYGKFGPGQSGGRKS